MPSMGVRGDSPTLRCPGGLAVGLRGRASWFGAPPLAGPVLRVWECMVLPEGFGE